MAAMEAFHQALNQCGLKDIGFKGYPYAWRNRRGKDNSMQVRLDRFVCSFNQFVKFSDSKVTNYRIIGSDHIHIVLNVDSIVHSEGKEIC